MVCKPYLNSLHPRHLSQSISFDKLGLEEAISSLEKTPKPLSIDDLFSILQKLRRSKNLSLVKRFYAYIRQHNLQDYSGIGNHLVPLFVDCGSLADAELAFRKVVCPNEHSWTSLILGHAQSGTTKHAFHLYQLMQEKSIRPSTYTIVGLLKCCSRTQDVENGRVLHHEIVQKGYLEDPFISGILIDMYVKCGFIEEAGNVFKNSVERDVVLWSALIAGYSEHGPFNKALVCFEKMQDDGVSPNTFTFSSVLKACGRVGATDTGRYVHMDIVKKGFDSDSFTGKSLVCLYANCGILADACDVFDKLDNQDAVSWTAMIVAFAEYGPSEEALAWFEQMELQGISPDGFTFSSVLKACGNMRAKDKGQRIHRNIIQEGFESDPIVGSALVSMYALCGSMAESEDVFHELPVRCVVSWNALIAGFTEHESTDEAFKCIEKMQRDGISPDAFTFAHMLKVSGTLGDLDRGRLVYAETVCKGYEAEDFVSCTLVGMYSKFGSLLEAQNVFNKLQVQDVVSWTALITGYAEHGPADEAVECFEKMQQLGIPIDDFTFACMLKAYGNMGALDKGYEIHQEVLQKGFEQDLFVGTSLLDLYSKSGSTVEAQMMFDKLSVRDVAAWNALISGFANHEGHMALDCFNVMQLEGVKPDAVTFACVLTACSHASLVSDGQNYFRMMVEDYKISPTEDHYTCMIDLLARKGNLIEAFKYLETMPYSASVETLRALLSACKMYGEKDLGLKFFQKLVQIDPEIPASYVLMADIYASAGTDLGRESDIPHLDFG